MKKSEKSALQVAMCLWCGRLVFLSKKGNLKYHKCAGGGKCTGAGKPKEI